MNPSELLVYNFSEIRRRSIKLWNGLPENLSQWKPDATAMSAIELIRHVLEADYGWNIIINQGDMTNYETPGKTDPLEVSRMKLSLRNLIA